MKDIQVKVLNPEAVENAEKMMAFTARLTQRGHKLKSMEDVIGLYEKEYSPKLLNGLALLPHPTVQKFGVINVVVVGASRRFLAQITRHQNEVKFMSASLQYSDYSDNGRFCIPYEVTEAGPIFVNAYLTECQESMKDYMSMARVAGNDAAGYLAPQGLRNILVISATPYQWKHMIGQRGCRRNTKETQYVMLKIWEQLYKLSPELFGQVTTGPGCMRNKCNEGKMSCGRVIKKNMTPTEILKEDFPLLYEEEE
ncbi:MAG: FAD-dependent thymidylate synthase [Erysipelotrichaceae bacterium]